MVRGKDCLKRTSLFLFIQVLFYWIITTVSHTKLPWYDAPLFPFFAMLIAIGLVQVSIEFKKITFIKIAYLKEILFAIFCVIVFIIPVQQILATSIQGKKETYYPELFYGDFINSVYTIFPQQKTLNIASEGYNPHLIFYTKVWQKKGRTIKIIPPSSHLQKGDSVLICEIEMCPKLALGLVYDTLLNEEKLKYFMRVISDSENSEGKNRNLFLSKINAIKNNPEWLSGIKEKSLKNNIDLEKQIMLDAFWSLNRTHSLSSETENYLKKKYHL